MSWLLLILILPYLILLSKCYRGLQNLKIFKISTEPSTYVSIIVACRNEEKNLLSLLNSLSAQNYPANLYEVIIINDNSTDKTFDIAEDFKGIKNKLIINNKGKGKKQALRTGIESAKGQLIITTDADCIMGSEWIKTIAAFYECHNPDMIICPVQIKSEKGLFGKFQELEYLSLQGTTAGFANENVPFMCNGANLAFPLKTYFNHSANLHDELNSGDDVFLLHSLKKETKPKIMWLESSRAMVTTEAATSFRQFIMQRCRWISKSPVYSDRFTIILGIVTFVTIVLQMIYYAWYIIDLSIIWILILFLMLKSIPDFLILWNTAKRYESRNLVRWFIPTQLIYPVYVLIVMFYTLVRKNK
jgi:poly-beta-1,6-N-acetyl-D-glucosamine synthase